MKYFHQHKKQDKAELYLVKAWERTRSIEESSQILLLAKNIDALEKISNIDIKIKNAPGTIHQFTTLATFLEKEGKSDLATLLLKRSISNALSKDDLEKIIRLAIELSHDDVFEYIQKRVLEIMDKTMDAISFVDFLLDNDRREDGVALFSAIATKSLRKSRKKTEHSLLFIQLAMKRRLLEEAAQLAIQYIATHKNDSFNVYVNSDYPFASKNGLPDPDQISLPLFYGLINEELGMFSKAERMYLSAALRSLDIVVTSSGRELPATLNEFNLLGRIWMKEGRVELLAKLDQAYSILETNALKTRRQQKKRQQLGDRLTRLNALQKESNEWEANVKKQREIWQSKNNQYRLAQEEQLKKRIAAVETEIIEIQKSLNKVTRKLYWSLPGTVVMILTMILLMAGCAVLSWQHANRCSNQKAYAWVTRFIELNGWVRVFSILGVLFGFFLICFGQFWQFPQTISENTRKRRLNDPVSSDPKPMVSKDTEKREDTPDKES